MLPNFINQWIVLFVVFMVIIGLFKEWLKPALTFFLGILVLLVFQIVTPEELLVSASNQQIVKIILLILITSALRKTLQVEALLDKIFIHAKSPRSFLIQMSSYVAILSSILNNTPVVAVMTPYVYSWCKRFGAHPSKLLIPLSYATILGGMITELGTSTNLVLNGFLEKNALEKLEFEDFFFLGILVCISGIFYLAVYGYKKLPQNKEAFDDVKAIAPEYLVETVVGSPRLAGMTVKEAGLSNLQGIYLIELHRDREIISPVSPAEILQENDSLYFMGKPATIMDLVHAGIGLRLPSENPDTEVVEAVIPANSALAGQKVAGSKFQEKYDAELVALHRNGEKITGKLDEWFLDHGDLLLLSVKDSFFKNADVVRDLYVISTLKKHESQHFNPQKVRWLLLGLSLIIGITALNLVSLFVGLLLMLGLFLILRLFSFKDISNTLDIDLVMILVCALTLGDALIKTGAAQIVSQTFIQLFLPFGKEAVLIGLFILTVILTTFITNVAAVSVAFPLAYSLAQNADLQVLSGKPFYLAIAFAASAAFMTPISYQTNWMVYGPGGYTTKDFFRVGFPLTILYSVVCITYILLRYHLE